VSIASASARVILSTDRDARASPSKEGEGGPQCTISAHCALARVWQSGRVPRHFWLPSNPVRSFPTIRRQLGRACWPPKGTPPPLAIGSPVVNKGQSCAHCSPTTRLGRLGLLVRRAGWRSSRHTSTTRSSRRRARERRRPSRASASQLEGRPGALSSSCLAGKRQAVNWTDSGGQHAAL
jgi:hypothetical protein